MAIPKWINTSEAIEQIADERLGEFVDDYTLEAFQMANKLLLLSLVDGTLPSKPLNPSEFTCTFESERKEIDIPLNDDGTIPHIFWYHFKDAWDQQAGILTTLHHDRAQFGENVQFVLNNGLIDNGRMIGTAGTVLVERKKLPGQHRRKRGERGAPYAEKDAEIVQQAIAAIERGDAFSAVIKRFAPMMPGKGNMTLPKSLESRLRNGLRARGYTARMRILNRAI